MPRLASALIAASLACQLSLRSVANDAPKKDLTVGIEYELWQLDKENSKPEKFEYTFYVIISNTTDHDVTIPTSTYDGQPCCFQDGMYENGVTYIVGERRIGRFSLVDSPARYFPIQLKPGQSAQFATYKLSSEYKKKSFSAEVDVEEGIAASQGWWSGSIRGTCDLTTQKPLP